MRHISALENDRFRRQLVEIWRVNFFAPAASKRIGSLLIGQKDDQVWLSLRGHGVWELSDSPTVSGEVAKENLCAPWDKLHDRASSPMKSLLIGCLALLAVICCRAADFDLAATATNQFSVDLYRQLATGDENLCVSPYSIESAMAMAFAGADGETRNEMARVLHLPKDGDAIHGSFTSLQRSLEEMATKIAKESKEYGGPSEPITIALANRLFGQTGYDFRDAFRALVKKFYGAPFEALDFRNNADGARQHINKWVAQQNP
jgi:hypothetical protein